MDFARESSAIYVEQARIFKLFRRIYMAALVISGLILAGILAGVRWREVTVRDLRSSMVEMGVYLPISAVVLILLYRASAWLFVSGLYVVLAASAVAIVNVLFLSTRRLKLISGITYSFVILLLVFSVAYAIFYACDIVNILFDSIRMDMMAAGG